LRHAGCGAVVEGFAHPPRLQKVSPRSALQASRPRRPCRAPVAGFRGNWRAPDPCRAAPPARCAFNCASAVPAPADRPRFCLSMAFERFVQHDHGCVLQQHPRKQHALHLPARQRADIAAFKAGETNRCQRLRDPGARRFTDAAKKSGRAPQPGADEVEHRDRKAAVDIGGLRQIGDIPDCRGQRSIDPASGLRIPTSPRNSVDLPAPCGPTTAIKAPEATSPLRWCTAGCRS